MRWRQTARTCTSAGASLPWPGCRRTTWRTGTAAPGPPSAAGSMARCWRWRCAAPRSTPPGFSHPGAPANHVAHWDGSQWTALGSGTDATVSALVVSGTTLYAGGGFSTAGSGPAQHIAQWDGSQWAALGAGTDAAVSTLAVSDTLLY